MNDHFYCTNILFKDILYFFRLLSECLLKRVSNLSKQWNLVEVLVI